MPASKALGQNSGDARGQGDEDPYLLTQEEASGARLGGEAAQDTMLAFDRKQADAVRWAALDSVGGRSRAG